MTPQKNLNARSSISRGTYGMQIEEADYVPR